MKRMLKQFLQALMSVQERRARSAALQQLDAHTLRDIGLEHEADRARRRARRDGLYVSTYH